MTAFDPWKSSWEDAQRAAEGWDYADPYNPIYQWSDAHWVKSRRAEVEAGDGFTLLACIRSCGTRGLVMPEWLAGAFNIRYDVVLNARAGSWDDPQAFGEPYPKHTRLSAVRKKRTLKFAVYSAVNEIKQRDPDRAIGPGLFEEVGRPLGIGKTLAEEYYYAAKKRLPPLD